MRFINCLFLFFFLTFHNDNLQAQVTEQDEIYNIYREQVRALLEERGVQPAEIQKLIEFYKGENNLTDQNIASLLQRLYPSKKGIAVIFYVFNNDSLHRIFFEPGKLLSHDIIPITKGELLQINTNMNHALGIYDLTSARSPEKRGLGLKPPPARGNTGLQANIVSATKLLIPPGFDSTYRHLILIPAMNIGIFPFHLLQPYGNDSTYLIDKCSFTVAPTLADVFILRMKILKNIIGYDFTMKKVYEHPIDSVPFKLLYPLFISNPAYPTNTEFIFPNLPGAENEIRFAKELAEDYKLLEGKLAVKDSVLAYLDEADLVYFATHGIADEIKPMEKSFLVLSGADPFLTAKEILNFESATKTFPEMVILSACQTGLGRSMEAGIAGLARSFLLRGSHHVIMSLWSVDDNSTAYLMNRFVWYLVKGNPFTPAEPLRRAILDTKKKYPHPSHWASFSLFGVNY